MKLILILLLLSSQIIAQTNIERAKKLWEEKKIVEAKKMLSAIPDENKDYAEAQYYLGRLAIDESKFDDAAEFFEEAVDANDKVADYHVWLGDTYATIAQKANLFRQGLLAPKMKKAWEKAIELDPNNINSRESLIGFYMQAPSMMGGSIESAKEIAKQLIKLKPDEGHKQMGDIFSKENKFPEAEKEYLEMVKCNPVRVPFLANFYMTQKQYDKAYSLYEEALKKNPEDFRSIYQIGRICAISGQRLDRGEECLKKYLTYQPKEKEASHAGANMRLGQIYEKRGNKAEAKKLYELAIKMDAKLTEAKEGLERVNK